MKAVRVHHTYFPPKHLFCTPLYLKPSLLVQDRRQGRQLRQDITAHSQLGSEGSRCPMARLVGRRSQPAEAVAEAERPATEQQPAYSADSFDYAPFQGPSYQAGPYVRKLRRVSIRGPAASLPAEQDCLVPQVLGLYSLRPDLSRV